MIGGTIIVEKENNKYILIGKNKEGELEAELIEILFNEIVATRNQNMYNQYRRILRNSRGQILSTTGFWGDLPKIPYRGITFVDILELIDNPDILDHIIKIMTSIIDLRLNISRMFYEKKILNFTGPRAKLKKEIRINKAHFKYILLLTVSQLAAQQRKRAIDGNAPYYNQQSPFGIYGENPAGEQPLHVDIPRKRKSPGRYKPY